MRETYGVDTLVTVKLHCGNWVALGATNMKPESIPAVGVVMLSHGAANVLWVTVWFFATLHIHSEHRRLEADRQAAHNSNAIVSPKFAVTFVGL
jgi:hypothetical protein